MTLAVDNRQAQLKDLEHYETESLNLSSSHLSMLDLMTPDNIAQVCKNYHQWDFEETDKQMCEAICDMLDYLFITTRSVYRDQKCRYVHETYLSYYARHANTK
jgi:hypothetical protein